MTSKHISNIYEHNFALNDYFILSTCNRTEVYSTSQQLDDLICLFCSENGLSMDEVHEYIFVKTGDDAIKHLFHVASGLDSQIIGDYEIIGQLKNAFNLAKSYGHTSGQLEKIMNTAVQASREVKKHTALSDGTISVSYAAIQLLKQKLNADVPSSICLLGLGKIGTLTLKNLKQHLPQHPVTIVNRGEQKAQETAEEFGVKYVPFPIQEQALKDSNVLIVATGADEPFILKEHIEVSNVKLIFDLSVPSNVAPEVKDMPGVEIYNIDELSAIVNYSLKKRESEIPLAEAIVLKNFNEYKQWQERRNLYLVNGPHNAVDNSLDNKIENAKVV